MSRLLPGGWGPGCGGTTGGLLHSGGAGDWLATMAAWADGGLGLCCAGPGGSEASAAGVAAGCRGVRGRAPPQEKTMISADSSLSLQAPHYVPPPPFSWGFADTTNKISRGSWATEKVISGNWCYHTGKFNNFLNLVDKYKPYFSNLNITLFNILFNIYNFKSTINSPSTAS